ncbi:hypothetical protein [Bradyrhizobium sp. URHD0069]|uniref:hypothetical protein n=1 Tax=Bradyrhizobium sp. URHD0069 TaxID=1380355 RepID=UPI000496D151|nr:hypothetical protein [Bradyrhizobium sp. URHD0069]
MGLIVFLPEGIQKLIYPDILGAGRFAKIGIPLPRWSVNGMVATDAHPGLATDGPYTCQRAVGHRVLKVRLDEAELKLPRLRADPSLRSDRRRGDRRENPNVAVVQSPPEPQHAASSLY